MPVLSITGRPCQHVGCSASLIRSSFGITGAALFCRASLIEDLSFEGEFFDEDFFAYREDADLAWRAQIAGWKSIYEPSARALHGRVVVPARRAELPRLINYHSVKNRFLLRMKNMDYPVWRRCFPYMYVRDLMVYAQVLTLERSSLPALAEVRRLRPRFIKKRAYVMSRRRVPSPEIASWFSFRPVAHDI